MQYPIVIHKDKGSDYGVIVPDLPGCFSAGSTLDEAIANAQEAIELHMEGLIEDGQPIPTPVGDAIECHHRKRAYKGGTWAVVAIDPATLRVHAKRINITMPQRVLDAVDRFVLQTPGQSRSGVIVEAVTQLIDRPQLKPRRARTSKQTRRDLKRITKQRVKRPTRRRAVR